MDDKQFAELQLRMMIVPHQVRWPAPEQCALATPARGRQRGA